MSLNSEAWPVKKENKLALEGAEMRIIRWKCGVQVADWFTYSELRETRNRGHNDCGAVK